MMIHKDCVMKLIEILEFHCENADQMAALHHYAIIIASESLIHQERLLAGALFDGLHYGNWPWMSEVLTDMTRKRKRKISNV